MKDINHIKEITVRGTSSPYNPLFLVEGENEGLAPHNYIFKIWNSSN